MTNTIFAERKDQIHRKGDEPFQMSCDKDSLAGAVSQRACVFCGSRVVLYPITDALHLVHGPIGCAAYTWDIRGALSSGPELHRHSYSTDLQESDVIFGGEDKLYRALTQLIDRISPEAAFVYSTCIVGIIGDDLAGVCKKVEREKGIPVIPVESEGFKGNKRAGYNAACRAMFQLVGTGAVADVSPLSVNILGDFNLAGEIWIIREYLERMGLQVVANITGDGRVGDIRRAHGASLNLVQCSGSTIDLAKMIQDEYQRPFLRVSFFGVEDMADSLYKVADFFKDRDPEILERTKTLVRDELSELYPKLKEYRRALEGKKAAIYVGGAFKAFSLVKAFRLLGMTVELVGSQTGTEEDYRELHEITDPGTIIVDDSNPLELSSFLEEKDVDIFVGGVKERPIAYKLGVGFCDHNHERKEALEGFVGMLNFAREVHSTVMSPVWRFTPRKQALLSSRNKMDVCHEKKRLKTEKEPYVATTDSCKLCAPLGACLAFKGVEGSVPFLHGSQGCATYMRRYVISHFREPVDIASSSLGEKHAVYGGGPNLKLGLKNVMSKYNCGLIGVATTCLTETIGDDTSRLVKEFQEEFSEVMDGHGNPSIVNVSTPSYAGSHVDGFHSAVRAIVDQLASNAQTFVNTLNLFPGFVSPADIRYLKEIVHGFGLNPVILPDISETLDAPAASEYEKIPSGGTPVASIKAMGTASYSIEFGRCLSDSMSASKVLEDKFKVPCKKLGTPIGLRETDIFMNTLEEISCRKIPMKHELERGRLIDSYVDGHKYVSGKRAVIYGDPDMVIGLVSFLTEIGIKPVLCATGAKNQHFQAAIKAVTEDILHETPQIMDNIDFFDIEETAEKLAPDVLLGSSKGYKLARKWNIPLIRLGFPIHDRFGAQRICQLGYKGAQGLFDMIVNSLIQATQDRSPVGYTYI